jgi:protein subunit release factor A
MSEMKPEDLRVEIWPPRSSIGGQHVGTGPHGIKVTHLPSGLEAFCEASRAQYANRKIAMAMIEWGLAELNV